MAEFSPEAIQYHPFNAETDSRALDLEVTPEDAYFVRSNFEVPELPASEHVITIGGEVEAPFELSVAELAKLPRKTFAVTTECAGNDRSAVRPLPAGEPWGAGALATAEWSGAPLRLLLERAKLKASTVEILFEGADGDDAQGFMRALPLDKALHEDTLLALEMNGAPLQRAHGAPVRLVVPGWYGMASVKWVRRITALSAPFEGHFQTEKYVYDKADGTKPSPVREMKVKSFISTPNAPVPAGKVNVRGFAWSGSAKVASVEIAVGGGDDWRAATLGRDLGRWAWRPFSLDLELPKGRHAIRCRARDDAGNIQPDASEWNRLGYGNNGVRVALVDVI